jgi:hypothetical protein
VGGRDLLSDQLTAAPRHGLFVSSVVPGLACSMADTRPAFGEHGGEDRENTIPVRSSMSHPADHDMRDLSRQA